MIFLVTNNPVFFRNEIYTTVSPSEALKWLFELTEICLDVETTGFDPHQEQLHCIQLGNQERQYVIDTTSVGISQFKSLLENRLIIGHNLSFDLKFLFKKGIYPRKIYDTFIVERILYCGLPTVRGALDFVTERYLGYKLDKSVRADINKEGLSTRVIKYAANDILPLELIKSKQQDELTLKGLHKVANLENRFTPVLAYIEYCGFHLDVQKWRAKMDNDRKLLLEAEDLLNKWVLKHGYSKVGTAQLDLFEEITCNVNWSSPQQVVELFEDIGINCDVIEKGVKKKSVEASVLEKQSKQFEIIPLYIKYKKAQKVISTYGDTFLKQINRETKRLHTRFTQILDTGRISSGGKNKATGEEYSNFQNIPADEVTRACFTAEEGNVLVIADYSGQEQIILANRSLDKNLLKFYDEGLADMHSFVASKMFPELIGLTLGDIKTNHKDKRETAKSGGFSINYGGTGSTIAENLGISREEGDSIYEAYFTAFPGLREYFNHTKKQGLKDGFILISEVTNRKSYLPFFDKFTELENKLTAEFWKEYRREKSLGSDRFKELRQLVSDYYYYKGEIERKSLNFPIQGSAAEITKISCIYIFDWILDNDLFDVVKFANTIHDENVLECPENLATTVAEVVKASMVKAGRIFCKRVPLKAEPDINKYWRK
jgi:DNA polymerase I